MDVQSENRLWFDTADSGTKTADKDLLLQPNINGNSLRHFENSTYTFAWLLQKLAETDETFKERLKSSGVSKIEYSEIGIGKGHASRIFRVDVYFADGKKPHPVVLKIPNVKSVEDIFEVFDLQERQTEAEQLAIKQVHENECRFYRHFARFPRLPLPKVFVAEEVVSHERDGAILMEFIGERGKSKNQLEPLNRNQVRSLVKGLAKVMAASLELDVSELSKYEKSLSTMELMMICVRGGAEQLLKIKPEYFEKPIKRIAHLIDNTSFVRYIHRSLNEELGMRPVLVHGDLWANNMFWKKNQNGECSDELLALIDWQIAHCGTVSRDLSHILIANTDTHLRKEIEDETCEYLHDCLRSELEAKNMEMPYTLEQIKRCYRREFVMQAIMLILYTVGLAGVETDESAQTQELKQSNLLRLKCVLEDAIRILETETPKWLDESSVPKPIAQPPRSRQSSLCKA